jgi:predicted P-loop ATPase
MMIGAAHRARVPGCKFDTIVVFESPEGWNKSSAIHVLAGDDNFSDEKIIGKESREVQEQLANVWIHENADLTGMKKADIDHVKAFASRTTDIARAAYGHFVKKQKRHSIEIGTTNNREYLQSHTGNRRFWPLEVLKAIDLDKLRRDRLQLWGEAATYERAGESVTLDQALWPEAMAAQEQRRTKDLWEIKLADIAKKDFGKKIIHVVGDQERIATLTLLDDVLGLHEAWQLKQTDTMRLRNVMKALGWQKSENKITLEDGSRVHGYFRDRLMTRIKDDPDGGLSREPDDNSETIALRPT